MLYSTARYLVMMRKEIRDHSLGYRTEKAYLDWIFRYFVFHQKKSPPELTEQDISTFLSFYAVQKQVSPSSQNQALYALVFFYRNVLKRPLRNIRFIRLQQKKYLPEVFTKQEIVRILGLLKGEKWLLVSLLYGCGLSLHECLSLRIRDIDINKEEIIIRGMHKKEQRKVVLPGSLKIPLQKRIESLRYKFMLLSLNDFAGISVPPGVEEKNPGSCYLFEWFYLFPTHVPVKDRQRKRVRYHHRSESFIQKSLKKCLRAAGITKQASCHAFRHSYALHMLEEGYDIRTVQQWIGHKNMRNTQVYRRLLDQRKVRQKSPLDGLFENVKFTGFISKD